MAAVATRGQFAEGVWTNMRNYAMSGHDEITSEIMPLDYETQTDHRDHVEMGIWGGMGPAQIAPERTAGEFESPQELWTTMQYHYTLVKLTAYTKELIADLNKNYKDVQKILDGAKQLGRGIRHSENALAARLFNDGFTSYKTGDGTTLFSEDHPLLNGETNANMPTTANRQFTLAALEQAAIDMEYWVDDGGLKMDYKPTKLIIPSSLRYERSLILDNPNYPGTANRDINPVHMEGEFKAYHKSTYLVDRESWYVCAKADGMNIPGLLHFEREGLEFGEQDELATRVKQMGASKRLSFMCYWPYRLYGSQGR